MIAVRLVGGPADGFVLAVREDRVPKFLGVGYPVCRYAPDCGEGEVRIFRYLGLD
jgi:hypothetical protein